MDRNKGLFATWPALAVFLLLQISPVSGADLRESLKGLTGGGGGLSEGKIAQGLKEALEVGADRAVGKVSQADGYYRNPQIRIPLPESVRKAEHLLKAAGYGPQVEAFELSMNRAAEKAAPQAKALLWEAVKKMSFEDARRILGGRENEATLYLKEQTGDKIEQAFQPLVHQAMSEVGVTRSYQDLQSRVKTIPFADRLNLDLDRYVTGKAMDGLFTMVGEEERSIRQNPTARATDLLKEVFGSKR